MASSEKTLLVVDDDEDWLALLGRLLVSEGYRVLTAQTCAEALRLAEAERPHCVIADLKLPGGGLTFCRGVKNSSVLKDVPVIVLSGLEPPAQPDDRPWDAFVCKGDGTDRLLKAVKKVLS